MDYHLLPDQCEVGCGHSSVVKHPPDKNRQMHTCYQVFKFNDAILVMLVH